MTDRHEIASPEPVDAPDIETRRTFLRGLGKWSQAVIGGQHQFPGYHVFAERTYMLPGRDGRQDLDRGALLQEMYIFDHDHRVGFLRQFAAGPDSGRLAGLECKGLA